MQTLLGYATNSCGKHACHCLAGSTAGAAVRARHSHSSHAQSQQERQQTLTLS